MLAPRRYRPPKLVNYFRGNLNEQVKKFAGKTLQELKKWFLFVLPRGTNCLTVKINGRYVSNKYVIKEDDKATYTIREIFCGECPRAMKEKDNIRILIHEGKNKFFCIHCVPENQWPENTWC